MIGKLRQSWEGIFKDIFGDASDGEWPVQLSREDLPVEPLHSEVVQTSAASAHSPAALIQRKTALEKSLEATEVPVSHQQLEGVLATKASSTLAKRAGPILNLKPTTLRWAAKFGVPLEVRKILGYHAIKGIKSVLHYSRDEQATPLRELIKVLKAVAAGTFQPDASRSGRFVKPEQQPCATVESGGGVSSETSDSSTSGSDSSDAAAQVAKLVDMLPRGRKPARSAST
eukprot:2247969-Amphidinium_carterae.2